MPLLPSQSSADNIGYYVINHVIFYCLCFWRSLSDPAGTIKRDFQDFLFLHAYRTVTRKVRNLSINKKEVL